MSHDITRRSFCTGLAGAAGLAAWPVSASQQPATLTARPGRLQLAPEKYPATEVWGFDGGLPGPVLRVPQGARLSRRLVNQLPEPTSIHWHGIRIDNAMDGVAGLTQEAVQPGGSFDYDFALPDAGTYWYHAFAGSLQQVSRGLSGALIVNEAEGLDIDRDEVLLLDDWLLNPEDGQFLTPFDDPKTLSHGGRLGNLIGTNGQYDLALPAQTHERLRLRLINGANARIFVLSLEGLVGWTVALDGMPLRRPEAVMSELVLAPGQRIDLIVDVVAGPGETASILRLDEDRTWRPQVRMPVEGVSANVRRERPLPLPDNPSMGIPGVTRARRIEMRMEGGASGGMATARHKGQEMSAQDLHAQGQHWAITGHAGLPEEPLATLDRGETVRLRLTNATAFAHAIHLHGTHFRELNGEGPLGPMRDTILCYPDEPREIAFVAENPGKWLVHCHVLDHAVSGMSTWIEVI